MRITVCQIKDTVDGLTQMEHLFQKKQNSFLKRSFSEL